MKKSTIVFAFGTRPEFIKMFPIITAARKNPHINTVVCSTGQHKELLENLYQFFNFKPDIDFRLMKPDQNLTYLHAETMSCMSTVIAELKPEWVVVQGDTTSAHAAAVAAFYQKISVAHVEAGLRTYDINSPFPEEMNRRAIGLVAKVHLCPTIDAASNLKEEKTDKLSFIEVTGNTGIDTLKMVSDLIENSMLLKQSYAEQFSYLKDEKFILATLHRRENFGKPLKQVLQAFLEIIRSRHINILFPVHPNPNVKAVIDDVFADEINKSVFWLNSDYHDNDYNINGKIFLTNPLEYPALVYAMKKCEFLMTDSGGLQEEAPSFGKKILVLRGSTERPEGIAAGFSKLVGTDFFKIVKESHSLLDTKHKWTGEVPLNPYGDGESSARILNILMKDNSNNIPNDIFLQM